MIVSYEKPRGVPLRRKFVRPLCVLAFVVFLPLLSVSLFGAHGDNGINAANFDQGESADPTSEETVDIVVFTPTTEGNTYWPQAYRIMRAAAESLGISLHAYEFPVEDRFAKHTEGVEILEGLAHADGAFFSVAFGQTRPLLEVARDKNIPVLIEGPLFPSELSSLGGGPRGEFTEWVGTISEDNHEKGYRLGRRLISEAVEQGLLASDGRVHVVGVGGDESWFGSQRRADGLRQAVEEEPRAVLQQVVPTQWTEADGRRVTRGLLERYPEVSVVWAASDQLAIAAADAIEGAGSVPGEDVLTGGLDLSPAGLRAIADGRVSATVGGSLFGYAAALVYLFDYIHGADFADITGTVITLETHVAGAEDASRRLDLYESADLIDYRELSRVHNSQREAYDFSTESLRFASDGGGEP